MNRSEKIYNNYDTIIIFKPTLDETDYDKIALYYIDLLDALDCINIEKDIIGKKKLAYSIKEYEQGFYMQFSYTATPESVASLERNLRVDSDAIKFISVITERDVEVLTTKTTTKSKSKSEQNKYIDAMDVLLGLAKYN